VSTSAVSRNYAATLFELAARDGSEERYGELIRDVARLYETDGGFHRFLNAPSIAPTEKKEVVRRALEPAAPDLFIRFLMVVLDRRRQSALPGIAEDYRRLLDRKSGRIRPIVTLPSEPDEALKATIVAALERRFDREIIPEFHVDRNILGGMVVRAGDHLLDASIRRQLKELKRQLL
jgi:F-type H+-transporting ATPase subunit delta